MKSNRTSIYKAILYGKNPYLTKCDRCGSIDLKTWELATRSADEPVSIFTRCNSCNLVICDR
jgi:DNA-directed RNA polymerase subunit M/transcription elongation factor TFIIS